MGMNPEVEDSMVDEVAESAGVDTAAPGAASLSFVVAIEEQPVPPLRLAHFGGEPAWFVQARHPRGDERKIRKAATGVSVVAKGADAEDDEDDGREIKVALDPDASFLNKCLYQITDFALPTNAEPLRRFDGSKKNGSYNPNVKVYEAILYARDQGLRRLLEEYLDWVAGRPHQAVHDFEALGNAPGQ